MPSTTDQLADPDAFTTNFTVSSALMSPRRTYEQTVSRFAPDGGVQEPNLEVRDSLKSLVFRSKQRGEPTFIYINNRLEGFAPGTTRPSPTQIHENWEIPVRNVIRRDTQRRKAGSVS
jgi:hypothetical protein